MKFTPEIGERIIARIAERIPDHRIRPCAVCGQTQWSLQDGFVALVLGETADQIYLGGSVLPSVVIMCRVCGNTHLLNLLMLGLRDLVGEAEVKVEVTPPEVKQTKVPEE